MRHCLLLWVVLGIAFGAHAQTLTPSQNEKGLYGFADEAGRMAIAPKYDGVHFEFYEGVACVMKKHKYVLIDTAGKELSKPYDWIGYFDDKGLCLVNDGGRVDEEGNVSGGKYGYIDRKGKEFIPVKYARIGDFNDRGVAPINEGGAIGKSGEFEGGKNGFVHTSGKVLVEPKYSFVGTFGADGLAWVNIGGKLDDTGDCVGGKFGYVDRDGIEVVEPQYDFIGVFDEDGLCWVNKGGDIFTSDKGIDAQVKVYAEKINDQALVIQKRRELEDAVTGGKCDVIGKRVFGGKYGFIDRSGKEIIAVKYTQTANHFVEGMAWAQLGKKFGYIDNRGREITEFIYGGIEPFHNGMGRVGKLTKEGLRYGFVNHTGREIIPCEYDDAGTFVDGFTFVRIPAVSDKKGKVQVPERYGFVNDEGKRLTEIKYDEVKGITEGVAVCRIGERYGYVDRTGKELTPCVFLFARPFLEGAAQVKVSLGQAATLCRGTLLSDFVFMKDEPNEKLTMDATVKALENRIAEQMKQAPQNLEQLKAFVEQQLEEMNRGMDKTNQLNRIQKSEAMLNPFEVSAINTPGYWGLIDRNGVALTDFIYTDIADPSEGWIAVATKDRAGWIDMEGQPTIPMVYEKTLSFHDGIAAVRQMGRWGYIDKQAQTVIECAYDEVTPEWSPEGVAGVRIGSLWGGIDRNGQVVIPLKLESLDDLYGVLRDMYLPHGSHPLSERDVEVYAIRMRNLYKRFMLSTVITDDYWDY